MIDFCLLYPIQSVEIFLLEYFKVSKNTAKYYFDKKFLKRAFPAHSVLQLPLDFVNELAICPYYQGPLIEICYEDNIFLVMNKPPNIHSHPLTYSENNNCLSFLREFFPHVLNINCEKYDRGLLYRLDFETSGVLIYIKQDEAFNDLRSNFKEVAKEKKYLCWVEGECVLSGKFKHFFKATEEKGKKIRVSDENLRGDFQEGELILHPKEYNASINATLMEVLLGRGIRHQIRSQLAFLGFPIRGDVLYGGKSAQRLYLHAQSYRIAFRGRDFEFNVNAQKFNGM